ncbi:MAG: hypothetical protein ACLR6J_04940 [Parabacteroides merdae]
MFRLTLPVKLPESIKQTEEEAITQTVPQKIEFRPRRIAPDDPDRRRQ